jgi:hypothetical protein
VLLGGFPQAWPLINTPSTASPVCQIHTGDDFFINDFMGSVQAADQKYRSIEDCVQGRPELVAINEQIIA